MTIAGGRRRVANGRVSVPTTGADDGGSRGTGLAILSPRLAGLVSHIFLALVCYVPMLLTRPGVVSDDTKTYLYLDPGGLLRGAVSMWDPGVALGTVTHQNIGYLFPMGPFYWVLAQVHLPIWVAQRLWLGSLLFGAAAGVLYLCRIVNVTGGGRIVAATAYALSPYVMQYAGRISVILLPFSGLPWMVAFMILACRRGGWRYPALFALVMFAVSGINASSVVYVIVAPLIWVPYAVFVERDLRLRSALMVLVKAGALTLLVSLWWIAGLSIEGIYGIDILKYTESVEAASSAAGASEVVRGLGYWYFYNGDRLSLWTQSSIDYTTNVKLLFASYLIPMGAFVSAALVRWRERAYFVMVLVAGLILSVGPHPFGSPTPLGALDKAFMTKTTAGNALRSTDRATPLVVLGIAMLLGAGITALARRLPRLGTAAGAASFAAALAAAAPLLAGDTVIVQFSQPAHPPSYVTAAASYLNHHGAGTRVYALPGNNFAAYTYGDTVDPIWAGLLKRPFVTHEQFIQGSMPTANLLYAIDNPLQQGTMNWRALAPIARLMSAGNVLVEYDEQYARYNTPRPALLAHQLGTPPPGLTDPVSFGKLTVNRPSIPMYDETYFDLPPGLPSTHPVVVYKVPNPRPIIRADGLRAPVVIAGDNAGAVDAAGIGLLARNPTILFSGTLATQPALRRQTLGSGAVFVLTDTNRKRAYEWNSLSENTGYTETASERPSAFVVNDPGFDLFPRAGTAALTTSVLRGISSVTASSYGTAFTLRSEWRPANAIDGNIHTAWTTEGTVNSPLLGQWWQVTARHPVSADSVTLVQPLPQRNEAWLTNQYVTRVTLTFDGHDPVTVPLGPESRTPAGETVAFGRRRFRTLRVTIDRTNLISRADQPEPVGSSLVGFAEVRVGNLRAAQIIAMPSDLLSAAGKGSIRHRLLVLMTRDRVAPVPPRSSPETAIVRQFSLPVGRRFSVLGTARLSNAVPDDVLDRLLGRHNALVVDATSSSRMPGNLGATASATLDGKPSTVWMPGLGRVADVGSWLQYRLRRPITLSHLSLTVSSDAEHSRPTEVLVSAGGVTRAVSLPPIPITPRAGTTTTVPLHFAPVRGSVIRLTFAKVAIRNTMSYETSLLTALPIGIAEVSMPGVPLEHTPARIPPVCRDNLLRVDGRPVPLLVTGSTAAALNGDGLRVQQCGSASGSGAASGIGAGRGLPLPAGTNLVQAASGRLTGLNLDQLVLDSAPGGAPMSEPGTGLVTAAGASYSSGAPRVTVLSESGTSARLRVTGVHGPFLLVLGESLNKGWEAGIAGGAGLTDHVLVDGFGNGWFVRPGTGGVPRASSYVIDLSFAPQKSVDVSLVLSALGVLLCLVILIWSMVRARRRRARAAGVGSEGGDLEASGRPEASGRLAGHPELSFDVLTAVGGGRAVADWRRVAVGVLLTAAIGILVAGPVVGAVAAVVALVAMTVPRARSLLSSLAAVVMIVAAAAVVLLEHVDRFLPGGGWPAHFSLASSLIWLAVVLLGADAFWEAIRIRRAGAGGVAGAGVGAAADSRRRA